MASAKDRGAAFTIHVGSVSAPRKARRGEKLAPVTRLPFMTKPEPGWWSSPREILKYGVAVASVACALASALWLHDHLVGAPVPLFLCAVMLSAWFGGLGPGLLASLLSVLAFDYYFVAPVYSLAVDIDEIPRLLLVAVSILFVGLLTAMQHGATELLGRARDELDVSVRELKRINEALRVENTERKRAEEALRETEQRFRDYAETASDWLWETGTDHRFLRISDHISTVGLDPAAGIGQRRWDVASDFEQEPEKWRAHIAIHEAHQPFRGFVYRLTRADGLPVYIETSGKPVFDHGGRFLGYRGVGSNITAEVRGNQAELALSQAQAELAHVTRMTTLGELTASIAHEVNQPLAAIVTNGAACLRWLGTERPDLDEARGGVECMISDGHRASEVIQRLRALCRKTDPQKARLVINDVIEEALLLVQREVLDHRVSLQRNLSPPLTPVLGDRVQLQQVIINLVMNGMEAMATVTDRPRDLLIRSHQQAADQVLVTVQDSGIGIEPENVDRLFSSFFTTKPGGMGMGLSICRSIIEAHDGRLWASRNVGSGATFQFTLPSYREPQSKEQSF
jgi:PAS domain S-box-containing protein